MASPIRMAPQWAPLLLAWCLVASGASPAAAQPDRGAIRGVVTDASGAAIAGAEITLLEVTTNTSRQARSDEGGRFVVVHLPPGDYQLRVQADGHRTHVADVKLGVHQQLRADVRLEVGPVASEVLVSAPLAPVRHETAALGTIIDERQVRDLPLDGRNFLELSLLAPGTAPAAEGSAASVRGDFAFTVGGREDANGFQLDGVDNVDPKLNTVALRPAVDAIREFEVQTGGHEAPIGRYAGGHVNVVLKSGSNDFNGTAYGFLRSGVLDARNFFAPADEPAPDYRRAQYGASIGGPIVRDKLFFFGDYEGTRLTEGITQVTNVPTLAERSGDFSASAFPAPVNPLTGRPFPGHRIPEFFQNPIGRAIANLYPLPNRDVPFANFVSSPNQTDDVDQFDIRIDRPMSGRFDVTARYSFSDRRFFEPFAGPSFARVPGFGNNLDRRAQNLVVGGVSVLTSSLLNEARFGFTRVSAAVTHENAGVSLNRQLGLPELSSNPRDWGLSFISVTGYSPLGHEFNNPQASTTNAFQIVDTLTWSRGAHLLRAGFDLRAVRQEAFRDVQSRGQLTFSSRPSYTGNALADLLLGLPVFTVGARLDNPQRLRTENVGLFVQENWRAAANLTISAGLRYELTSPPVDVEDRANIYDPATAALVQVGTGGIPRAGYETDRNNFAPRVGIVWSPGGAGETVLRGSYGIYYNQGALAPSEGLYFSDPYFHLDFFFPVPGLVDLTLFDPFPAAFPIPSPQSGFTFQRDLQTPMLQQWSVGIQRQLGASRSIEIAYVGSKGTHLVTGRDLNQPPPSAAPFNPRPNPAFNDIIVLESAGRSRYDSLQLRVEQRTRRGLTGLASYTLGHARDDASGFFPSAGDPNFPQNSDDRAAEWGRSSYDVRHRFSAGFVWEVPSPGGDGVLPRLARDWQISGILTLQSGRPFTVALLPELDNSNTGRTSLGFGANDRPNVVGDPALSDPSPERWFNTDAFVVPPFGTFGDSGRNTVEGPGFANVNIAGIRSFSIGTGMRLQARVEVFNLFNRANFNQPDPFVGSPTFGRVLSAQSPRRVQLGLRAIF
ncbi:MAG TPA: TonB-dependent receptor [Vicinamibacterales bacterium]|nr:TonB-dependent receptor [Vicinamibacterales bacterium]